MCSTKPDIEGQQARENQQRFGEFACGDAQALERRKAEFNRDGQQPGHAFFGEAVHNKVRGDTDEKGIPHDRGADMRHNRVEEIQQQPRQQAEQGRAEDGMAEETVTAQQPAEHFAKQMAFRQVAPQGRGGLVDIRHDAADLVRQHGYERRGEGEGLQRYY